jgi:predicted nucleic acid-binding protein
MRFVIDTSIVFSLFKSESFTNRLLKEHSIDLVAPFELISELKKYSKLICSKSKISEKMFISDLKLISNLIELRNPSSPFLSKASQLISHKTDIPFLALELNIPLWSNDEHFKEQDLAKVFTTEELKEFLDI